MPETITPDVDPDAPVVVPNRRDRRRRARRRTLAVVIAAATLALVPSGIAHAGGPRAAPKSECRAAARVIVAIDHHQRVWSDDLSFAGMPAYVDAYNERLAARQPYPDPAGPAQMRAWLAGEVANGCSGAVAPGKAGAVAPERA